MNEWLCSAPNAVDLAHAVLPQKRAQPRGHLAEAEAELGRAATERELVVLGEVDLGRLSVDSSGRLENKQVVVKGVIKFAGREAHYILRHRALQMEAGSAAHGMAGGAYSGKGNGSGGYRGGWLSGADTGAPPR